MRDRWLTTNEAAELIGCRPKTLVMWRYRGRGPRYAKVSPGRSGGVRYRYSDITAWMEQHTRGGEAA